MSNIATGIGLSGQLKVDDSGQLNRLAAEQAAAQQRQKEAAAKKKADDALLKDIASNTIFSKTMIQPRNQADAESRLTQGLADIVKSIGEGDQGGNPTVNAYTKLNKLSQEINTLAEIDKQQTANWAAAFKEPEKYAGYFMPRDINGKTYNNGYEAFNAGEPPEEIAKAWPGTEHIVMKNDVLGSNIYMPNPQRTMNALESIQSNIKPEMYSVPNTGEPITGPGDETYVPVFNTLNPIESDALIDKAVNNMAVRHAKEVELIKEGKFNGKYDDAFHTEVTKRIVDELTPILQNLKIDKGTKTFTPPAPKAAKAGDKPVFEANERAQQVGGYRGGAENGSAYEWLITSKSKPQIVNLPAGTIKVDGNGVADLSTTSPSQADVYPWRVTRVKDNIYFDYRGTGKDKDVYYSVPESQGAYEAFVGRTSNSSSKDDINANAEAVLQKMLNLGEDSNRLPNLVKGWHKKLYGEHDEPKKMNAQGNKYGI